jgi:hypothetical protein
MTKRHVRGWLGCVAMALTSVVAGGAAAAPWDDEQFEAVAAAPPGRATVARAADLEPRLLGTESFHWDGTTDAGLGWMNNVIQGEYAERYNVNGWITRVIVCAFGNAANVSAVVQAKVYDDDGPGGAPGTLLSSSEGTRIPAPNTAVDCSDITVPAVQRNGLTFVGVSWMPVQNPGFFIATDNSGTTAAQTIFNRGRTTPNFPAWTNVRTNNPQIRAFGIGYRGVSNNQATAPCFDSASILCLNNSRFRVEIDHRRPNDLEGLGLDSGLRTDDSGILYFFDPANLEMLIKVLNSCAPPFNRYWVFFAATTNVEFHVTVTDTQSGQVRTYFNPLGKAALPVQDTQAFATCP